MINVTANTDPLGQFKGIKPNKLIEATGLIPHFIQDVALSDPMDAQEAFELMIECYGFGGEDTLAGGKGEVTEEGVYRYPEDPDLYPLVSFTITEQDIEILVYQYGFVVVRDEDNTLMVRMD